MKRLGCIGLSLLLPVIAVGLGLREAGSLRVVRVEIVSERLPPAFDNYRVLLLSCLHLRGFGALEGKLVRQLESERFDLAVLAGDFRHSSASAAATIAGLDGVLPAIEARDGVVGCPGNHDTPLVLRAVRERGVRLLMDEVVLLRRGGQAIRLIGLADPGGRTADLGRMLESVPPDRYTILIAHSPDAAEPAARAGIDLVLAGDTHGGQIVLPLVGPLVTKTSIGRRFVYGLNHLDGTLVYTHPGIGTTGLPLRLGRPPEVTILTLRRGPGGPG